MTIKRLALEVLDSSPVIKPMLCPKDSLSELAKRRATCSAAKRLGSNSQICCGVSPPVSQLSFKSAKGRAVDFPAPGGACTIKRLPLFSSV